MINRIKSLAKDVTELYVRPLRHQLHRNPELSFVEYETSQLIHDVLDSWEIENVSMNVTGVVATIKGRNPEKRTIALRADIDALPIQETNICDYKSLRQNVMHACGHDAHTAMLLGVANILNQMKDEFEGTIKLIFQPGEEKLPGGAKLMIENGVLDNVDAIIAQHVYPDLPCGEVGFYSGNYMAACDEINIMISGKGGHAAKIKERSNTTVAAAKMLCAISELSSEFNKEERENPIIIAFGSFIADGTYNVIPDTVNLKGTMRTFDEKERKLVKKKIKEISSEVAKSFGVKSRVKIDEGYPVLKNDVDFTDSLRNNAMDFLGEDKVKSLPQLMTAEDFAWYSHKIKACMYRIGTSNIEKGITSKQHTSTFNIDEDALETGVGLMAYIAIETIMNC
ncbi:MAG: amidohydrolase [Lentimicrobiaceae bacterium]|nr:amidohydrolase [Lentimicrobiaceae bacterium]